MKFANRGSTPKRVDPLKEIWHIVGGSLRFSVVCQCGWAMISSRCLWDYLCCHNYYYATHGLASRTARSRAPEMVRRRRRAVVYYLALCRHAQSPSLTAAGCCSCKKGIMVVCHANGFYGDKSPASIPEDPYWVSSPLPTAVSQAPVALSHLVGASCLPSRHGRLVAQGSSKLSTSSVASWRSPRRITIITTTTTTPDIVALTAAWC